MWQANQERCKLERLCRYVARPAIALERLSRDGDGLVVYEFEHAFHDGTTHVSRSRASMRFAALVHPCTACSSHWTSVALGILPPATLARIINERDWRGCADAGRCKAGAASGAQAYLDGTSSTRGKPNAADTGSAASAAKCS